MDTARSRNTSTTGGYSRLCNRNESALLLSDGTVRLFGGHEPSFTPDDRLIIGRTGGQVLSALAHEEVKQMCVGNSHNLFLTATNKVYLSGSNQFGQLGISDKLLQSQDHISLLDTSFLSGATIRQIDTGILGGSAILTNEGTVFTAGEGNGRAPPPAGAEAPKGGFEAIPAESFDGEPVVFVSQGGCLSLYITTSGAVYVTGGNWNYEASGMLGMGNKDEVDVPNYQQTPKRLDTLWNMGVRAVSGCAGRLWAVVLDEQGRMFGWGCNRNGQLGLGEVQDQHVPVLIPIPQPHTQSDAAETKSNCEGVRVVQVSCSWTHTLALTSTGEVLSFGDNSAGSLGRATADNSHAVPGLMDLSRVASTLYPHPQQLQRPVVVSVHAGMGHSLLEVQEVREPNAGAGAGAGQQSHSQSYSTVYASCGLARHGQLAGWDHLEEMSFIGNLNIVNLCRKIPAVIDMEGVGIGAANIGSVIYVPAVAPLSVGKRRRRHEEREVQEISDDSEEDEEGDWEEDWEDDDINVCLTLDYSTLPLLENNSVATTFRGLADKVLGHQDLPVLDENDATPVDICIANHYNPVDIEQLIDCLRHPVFQAAMKLKFKSLTFVSTTLMVCSPSHINELSEALALYPHFSSLTLDLSSLYTVGSPELENGTSDDRLLGQFCSSIIRKVTSLHHLAVEGLGDISIASVCEACVWRENSSSSCADLDLDFSGANFSLSGFQQLATVLSSPSSVLSALRLPEHNHLTPAAVAAVASSLATNTSLHTLDLHVTELGHVGVRQDGVSAIVTALETNSSSKLCKLDVSGDDGEPMIGAKLQRRLTKCLVRNSKDNFQGKYLKYAKMKVYSCHDE